MSATAGAGRLRNTLLAILIASVPLIATAADAHQRHARPAADTARAGDTEGASAQPRDTIGPDSNRAPAPVKPPAESYVMPPLIDALLEHPHNKIVHFTIVLVLVATLLLWLPWRTRELIEVARFLIWAAAATAIAAYFTGQAQAEAFEGEPKEWVTLVHRNWGITAALALLAWAVLAAWRPRSRATSWWGLLASLLIGIVAFLGGVVAHG